MNKLRDTDVLILCGGLGSRLKEITKNTPKSLVEIGGRPFLDILLSYLTGFGFRHYVFAIGYKGDVIRKYLASSKYLAWDMRFSLEKEPLGTGGAVKKARASIQSDHFLVLNGDSFCKIDLNDFSKFCLLKKGLVAAIALKNKVPGKDYGSIKVDTRSRIIHFKEKTSESRRGLINAGVYYFNKKIFRLMPRKKKFSLEHDLFPKLIGKGFYGYPARGFFIDIGTPQRLEKARRSHLAKSAP
jgi:NDP-sugar pyrophosphorylase family protein